MFTVTNAFIALVIVLAFVVCASAVCMFTPLAVYALTAQIFVYSIGALIVSIIALCVLLSIVL